MEAFTGLATVFAIAYALGTISYQFLGFPRDTWYQVLPFGITAVLLGESLWAAYLPAGPVMFGIHPAVALVAVPVAVAIDIVHRSGWSGLTQAFRKGGLHMVSTTPSQTDQDARQESKRAA